MLIPLMRDRDQIDSLYSIFILDLGFIMPAFLILAVLALSNHGVGLVLLPSLYVLGFTLIFSLALAELVKPVVGTAPDLLGLTAATAVHALSCTRRPPPAPLGAFPPWYRPLFGGCRSLVGDSHQDEWDGHRK
ncbi:hypothetical protein E3O42_05185 [Cryobacterium adonitolivorans]|uniref:Uncharacterized protein n=1 Tax=Cryobacterium adonitolivorans TaxID=1259189 RepID=A0A4R8W8I4_9MICO|nr:hypothetical protein [Cryobacterium adonitolivorans]TFC04389.1 hypothetical protein E3O42_05185 [Cryobacterium adonitolivorans]